MLLTAAFVFYFGPSIKRYHQGTKGTFLDSFSKGTKSKILSTDLYIEAPH